MRFILSLCFIVCLAQVLSSTAAKAETSGDLSRVFEFNYRLSAADFPFDKAIDVYIPLPAEHGGQQILKRDFESSIPGQEGHGAKFNNGYYRIHRPANTAGALDVSLSWTISRDVVTAGDDGDASSAEQEQFLAASALVPVAHSVLAPILAEIHELRANDSKEATARAIYDWVVDNIEYKKVGTGWGNGDTYWACNERYGNCTDFHALFVSLARSEGIPARFEIGFPVPQGRSEGEIGGYHCWVQFFLPERGWIPIDASEAAKHPEQRDLYYGTHPADRIHFTTGRDIVLSELSEKIPLNYFIYPYVEVGGKPWDVKLDTHFSYKQIN
jgi:transglutaminase-like putative cysteine protease